MKIIVPVKAHSERVPNKNTRPFAGGPSLLQRLLTKLTTSDTTCVSKADIIVNTDSVDIANSVAWTFPDVQVLMRPMELQGDDVSMNAIIAHTINSNRCPEDEPIVQVHVTSPFLTAQTIASAIDILQVGRFDSVYSVTQHYARGFMVECQSNGVEVIKPINYDKSKLIKTQDLQPIYFDNSLLYAFTARSFGQTMSRIGARPWLLRFGPSSIEAMDIDTEYDWKLCELIEASSTIGCNRSTDEEQSDRQIKQAPSIVSVEPWTIDEASE